MTLLFALPTWLKLFFVLVLSWFVFDQWSSHAPFTTDWFTFSFWLIILGAAVSFFQGKPGASLVGISFAKLRFVSVGLWLILAVPLFDSFYGHEWWFWSIGGAGLAMLFWLGGLFSLDLPPLGQKLRWAGLLLGLTVWIFIVVWGERQDDEPGSRLLAVGLMLMACGTGTLILQEHGRKQKSIPWFAQTSGTIGLLILSLIAALWVFLADVDDTIWAIIVLSMLALILLAMARWLSHRATTCFLGISFGNWARIYSSLGSLVMLGILVMQSSFSSELLFLLGALLLAMFPLIALGAIQGRPLVRFRKVLQVGYLLNVVLLSVSPLTEWYFEEALSLVFLGLSLGTITLLTLAHQNPLPVREESVA